MEPSTPPAAPSVELPDPEPIDLLDDAGTPGIRRLLPVLGGLAVIALVVVVLRRRRRR